MLNFSTNVFLLILHVFIHFNEITGKCMYGTYGKNCEYTCHCIARCDSVNGCSGQCQVNWFGTKCTMKDVAFRKTALQMYGKGGNASKADVAVSSTPNCLQTASKKDFSWWQVDLEKTYFVHNIIIEFNPDKKYKSSRDGLEVYISSEPMPKQFGVKPTITKAFNLCGTSTLNSSDHTEMMCDAEGQYLTVYQKHPNHNELRFCKVRVLVCEEGTFGETCGQFCQCKSRHCDPVTGICPAGGCKHPFTGANCYDCEDNHYGLWCQFLCTERHCNETKNVSSCDRQGKCDFECEPGWMDIDCSILEDCAPQKYGLMCDKECSERLCDPTEGPSTCDRDGRCSHGCLPGFLAPDCLQPCTNDTYGLNCLKDCKTRHCKGNTACFHVTGKCVEGCKHGYQGVDCVTTCADGFYGENCTHSCQNRHCLDAKAKCDEKYGDCRGKCQESWVGDDCSEKLAASTDGSELWLIPVGTVAFGIILVCTGFFIFVWRKRRKTNKNFMCTHQAVQTDDDDVGMSSVQTKESGHDEQHRTEKENIAVSTEETPPVISGESKARQSIKDKIQKFWSKHHHQAEHIPKVTGQSQASSESGVQTKESGHDEQHRIEKENIAVSTEQTPPVISGESKARHSTKDKIHKFWSKHHHQAEHIPKVTGQSQASSESNSKSTSPASSTHKSKSQCSCHQAILHTSHPPDTPDTPGTPGTPVTPGTPSTPQCIHRIEPETSSDGESRTGTAIVTTYI